MIGETALCIETNRDNDSHYPSFSPRQCMAHPNIPGQGIQGSDRRVFSLSFAFPETKAE